MSIRAYGAPGAKIPLEPFVYEPEALGPNDVEINISHCGVCHSDIHILDGDWGAPFPAVAGHEIIGTVSALGEQVTHLKMGQRVGVGWQAGSCLECEWCMRGEENLCPNSRATCRGRYGGFAEAIRVDGRFAHPIPDELETTQAAPLLCAGITVYSPLRHFGVHSTSRVGVIGIGGLGHLGVQFAAAFGCEVTAFSTSPNKEAEARMLGAAHFVASSDVNALKHARNSLDFILCTVNVQLDWNAYLRILRPNGVLCLVGAIPGEISLPVSPIIGGQRSVRGGSIGSRSAMREMLDFAVRHHITAQVETMPMTEINAALERVRGNHARYRVVLTN